MKPLSTAHKVIPIEPVKTSLYVAEAKVYPRAVSGRFARWRWIMVALTQAFFYGMPWLQWQGRQALLFDIDAGRFVDYVELDAASSATWGATSVVLTRRGSAVPASSVGPTVRTASRDAVSEVIEVPDRGSSSVLVVPENVNPGWEARLDGERLAQIGRAHV